MKRKKLENLVKREVYHIANKSRDESYNTYNSISELKSHHESDDLQKLTECKVTGDLDINPEYLSEIARTINKLIERDKERNSTLLKHEKIISKFKSENESISKCNIRCNKASAKIDQLSNSFKDLQKLCESNNDSLDAILDFVQRCADNSSIPFKQKWKLPKLLRKITKYIKNEKIKAKHFQNLTHSINERNNDGWPL